MHTDRHTCLFCHWDQIFRYPCQFHCRQQDFCCSDHDRSSQFFCCFNDGSCHLHIDRIKKSNAVAAFFAGSRTSFILTNIFSPPFHIYHASGDARGYIMHLAMHDILPNLRRSSPAARQTVSIRPVHHIPSHSRHRSPLPDGVLPPAHSLPAWQSEMLQCSNLLLLSRNVLCPVYSFSQNLFL